jgi:transcriptional repressor NrdR
VVKRNGIREEFYREKLLNSMVVACRKRPVPLTILQEALGRVEGQLFDRYDQEVTSSQVGEQVLRELATLDEVAFVRFASVYREFDCLEQFSEIIQKLKSNPVLV